MFTRAIPIRGDLVGKIDHAETSGFQRTVGRRPRRRRKRRVPAWMYDPEQVGDFFVKHFPEMTRDGHERELLRAGLYHEVILGYFLGGKGETAIEIEFAETFKALGMKMSRLGAKDYEKTYFEPYPHGTVLRSPVGDIARKIIRLGNQERLDGKPRTFGKPGRPKSDASQRAENILNIVESTESTQNKLTAFLRGEKLDAADCAEAKRRRTPDWVLDDFDVRAVLYKRFPKMFKDSKQRARAARWHYVLYAFYKACQSESEIARTLGITLSNTRYILRSIQGEAVPHHEVVDYGVNQLPTIGGDMKGGEASGETASGTFESVGVPASL